MTCRGPFFNASYERYQFDIPGVKGTTTVIVPKNEAAGKPWAFRADFVNLLNRDTDVDLALLAKGFHIVVGPVSYDVDGPILKDWNAVYKYLVEHGFSKKPVLEGAGGAAGDAYAWAIENPDNVACIYVVNPVLRSRMTKTKLLENLAPLAKANIRLLHVCGSKDPWLAENTTALESRYKELGGNMTVIMKEGEGHFPLAPKDVQPVAEFIVKSVN